MSPRSPRRTLAPGVYADARGLAVVAKAAGRRVERRFPLGTPLRVLRAWQDDARAQLRDAALERRAALPPGSLAEDVALYLPLAPAHQRKELAYLLAHWVDALGTRPRHSLAVADFRAVEASWTAASVSARRHRRRALVGLYRALDGPDAPCPVAQLPRLHQPRPEPRAIPFTLAETVLSYVSERGRPQKGRPMTAWDKSKSRARLRVMLYTGLPAATLRRIRPQDVDLDAGTVTIPPRAKGRGAPAATLPLLPQAIAAFREWLAACAWGGFSSHSLAASFRRAVAKARHDHPDVPAGLRVYDLRHTFLSHVLEQTGDLAAVAELGQHASLQTTRRYTQRAASARASAAIAKVAGRR